MRLPVGIKEQNMNKQPHITEATKQALIDAFCELAGTMPVDKITIQALTRRAGYNRCTFYTYFNNVQNLMEHIENEVITFAKDKIPEAFEAVNVTERFIAIFTEDTQKMWAKYVDILFSNSHSSGFAKRLKDALLPVYMKHFNISADDLKSRYVLDFHISGMISITTSWVLSGRDIPVEKLGEAIQGILTKGVLKTLTKSY